MIASLSGHLPEGSPLPSWTNPREPNFVSTSASHLLPSPTCWPFSGQQLRATTRAMATWTLLRSSTSANLSTLKTIPCWFAFRLIIEALASHQCGPGSIPRSRVICELSLLLLYSAARGFLPILRFSLSKKKKTFDLIRVNC